MKFSEYLTEEWRPALGCTEPASIAYAASSAAGQAGGEIVSIELECDPRIYKNCYAVGIPNSGHKTGILWALAIGSQLPDPGTKLECFRQITPAIVAAAQRLIDEYKIRVKVLKERNELYVNCHIVRRGGEGRAIIEHEHTALVRLEKDGQALPIDSTGPSSQASSIRQALSELTLSDLIQLAQSLTADDRALLNDGIEKNRAIAHHGQSLFPKSFIELNGNDPLNRASALVSAGVYARMWGEDFTVMSLAGSGNKGITCSVPLDLWGRESGLAEERIDESLALACLITSTATYYLGTLSAACGCSNSAGIGLAAGLVYQHGGSENEIDLAINNMVGNVTGMICDGAKIGCALKTMTSVDAAFRSATLAMNDIGIPVTDGIVGASGFASLHNLGRIATQGLASMDEEILGIMQDKLLKPNQS